MDDSLNTEQLTTEDITPTPTGPVGMTAVKAPDGSWWISVTHTGVNMSFSYAIPLDQADRVADEFATNLKGLAAEARRARSGLVLAGDVPKFNRSLEAERRNGQRR